MKRYGWPLFWIAIAGSNLYNAIDANPEQWWKFTVAFLAGSIIYRSLEKIIADPDAPKSGPEPGQRTYEVSDSQVASITLWGDPRPNEREAIDRFRQRMAQVMPAPSKTRP